MFILFYFVKWFKGSMVIKVFKVIYLRLATSESIILSKMELSSTEKSDIWNQMELSATGKRGIWNQMELSATGKSGIWNQMELSATGKSGIWNQMEPSATGKSGICIIEYTRLATSDERKRASFSQHDDTR